MDERDDELFKIATDALRFLQRHCKSVRHQDQWGRAITALYRCREDIQVEQDRVSGLYSGRAPSAS